MIDFGAYEVISGIVSAIALSFSIYTYLAMRKMRRAEYLLTRKKLLKEDARIKLIAMRDKLTMWKIEKEEKTKKGGRLSLFNSETWGRQLPRVWLAKNLYYAFLSSPFASAELWNLIMQDDFFEDDTKIEKAIQIMDKTIRELP